jgi:hypothetical protein
MRSNDIVRQIEAKNFIAEAFDCSSETTTIKATDLVTRKKEATLMRREVAEKEKTRHSRLSVRHIFIEC